VLTYFTIDNKSFCSDLIMARDNKSFCSDLIMARFMFIDLLCAFAENLGCNTPYPLWMIATFVQFVWNGLAL
jgi:hypothetical protein